MKVKDYFKYEIDQRAAWLKAMRAARDDKALNEIMEALVALDDFTSISPYAGSVCIRGYVSSYDEHVARVRDAIAIGTKFNLRHTLNDEFKKDGTATIYFSGFRLNNENFSIYYMVNLASGASCKLVQVGTKTIEQPIYEVQCE